MGIMVKLVAKVAQGGWSGQSLRRREFIGYYINGHLSSEEHIGRDRRLTETLLRKRKVYIAEGKFSYKYG